MKILWDNYLFDSTVTATSENTLYPVENLFHNFLEKKFQATTTSVTVTVLFPEDRTVSMIAYGFHNVETSQGEIVLTKDAPDTIQLTKGAADTIELNLEAQFVLKNSVGSTVYSGTLNTADEVNINYFTATTCRSVEVTFASGSVVYVGGLSIGDPLEYEYTQINPQLMDNMRSDIETTNGGQVIGRKLRNLREWSVIIPSMTNAKRLETNTMIDSVSTLIPVYADLWEDANYEKPMHCVITQAGTYRRDSKAQDYTMGLTLVEAR